MVVIQGIIRDKYDKIVCLQWGTSLNEVMTIMSISCHHHLAVITFGHSMTLDTDIWHVRCHDSARSTSWCPHSPARSTPNREMTKPQDVTLFSAVTIDSFDILDDITPGLTKDHSTSIYNEPVAAGRHRRCWYLQWEIMKAEVRCHLDMGWHGMTWWSDMMMWWGFILMRLRRGDTYEWMNELENEMLIDHVRSMSSSRGSISI